LPPGHSQQTRQQLAPEPAALPVVGQHDREFRFVGPVLVFRVARDPDLALATVCDNGGDERHIALVVDIGEPLDLLRRQTPRRHPALVRARR